MNKIYLFVLGLFLSVAALGQQTTKQQNLRKLIDITTKGQLGDSVIAMMLNGFKKQYPEADSAFWKSVESDINMNGLFDQLIPIYDKYYTDDDVRQLIAFYEQPIGQKMIAVLPRIMNESISVGQQWGIEANKKIQDKLKAAGY